MTSTFVGYDKLSCESEIIVLTSDTEVTEALSDGDRGTVFVKETPFYATSGGQEADTGVIRTADGEFRVEDTIKLLGGKIGHVGVVTKGMIKVGDTAELEVNAEKRALSARNHSATHLLQKALRTVLGSHVEQAGSSVNEDRLRFDFTHFSAMTQMCIRDSSYMMSPTKSVTAVIGAGTSDIRCHTKGCEACEKQDCIYRRNTT